MKPEDVQKISRGIKNKLIILFIQKIRVLSVSDILLFAIYEIQI